MLAKLEDSAHGHLRCRLRCSRRSGGTPFFGPFSDDLAAAFINHLLEWTLVGRSVVGRLFAQSNSEEEAARNGPCSELCSEL